MKKLLVVLLVLGAIFVAVDLVVKNIAEDKAAEQLRDRLGLNATPVVSFSGWPFLLRALDGSFPEVGVSAERLEERGLVFSEIDLSLENVTFSVSDILDGKARAVRAKGGTGSASLSEGALNQVLANEGAPFEIDLSEGGASADVPGAGRQSVDVSVADGRLILQVEGAPSPVSITLPQFLDNVTYESGRVTDSSIEMEVKLGPTSLQRPTGT